jgi:hypothetical protein
MPADDERRVTVYACECGYRSLTPGKCAIHPYHPYPLMKAVEVSEADATQVAAEVAPRKISSVGIGRSRSDVG